MIWRAIRHPHTRLLALYALRIKLDPRSWGGVRELIETTYRVMLRRPAGADGFGAWGGKLERGELTWTGLIWQALCSDEFRWLHPRWSLPYRPAEIQDALHKARCLLVQRELPLAGTIVDLGGACPHTVEGALLWMGYPHPVSEITIIDLSPDERMYAETFDHRADESDEWIVTDRARVRYIHTSMVDMSGLADESVDMVWSGESIEHITPEEARHVYTEVMRVLKPGGHFCLDTPNRALTRLHNPRGFIHPEHKIEYTVPELVSRLTQAGFTVNRTIGMCPMPRSLRKRLFYPQELVENAELADDPESAYLFYVESVK
jgi:SAM-dependent methyltransferase